MLEERELYNLRYKQNLMPVRTVHTAWNPNAVYFLYFLHPSFPSCIFGVAGVVQLVVGLDLVTLNNTSHPIIIQY